MSIQPREENVKSAEAPKVEMLRYDVLKGTLVVIKQKRFPGTGQTYVTEMQFQITDDKPKRSCTVPPKVAEFWNSTHFTARFQSTELMFPAGKKLDYWWIYNEGTEDFNFIVKEFEEA